jgi:hypothetical protein
MMKLIKRILFLSLIAAAIGAVFKKMKGHEEDEWATEPVVDEHAGHNHPPGEHPTSTDTDT